MAVPIGLFFGRIANFINGELYGRATEVKWAVIFPHAGMIARHPSQLYEAFLEGLFSFFMLYFAYKKPFFRLSYGRVTGLFLLLYSMSRIIIECFREPDSHIGYLSNIFTMGQILSLPMLILGFYLVFYNGKYSKQKN